MELQTFGKNPRNVSMTLEAVFFNQGENSFHLPLIVDIFGEDIFVQWVPGGTVHEEEAFFPMAPRPFGKKFPAAFFLLAIIAGNLQLRSGPENGSFRRW